MKAVDYADIIEILTEDDGLIEIPKFNGVVADVHVTDGPLGVGYRYIMILKARPKQLFVRYMDTNSTIRSEQIKIRKLCGGLKLYAEDGYFNVIFPDGNWYRLGKCKDLRYNITPEEKELYSNIVATKSRKTSMTINSKTSVEDLSKSYPQISAEIKVFGEIQRFKTLYLIAMDGIEAFAYGPKGDSMRFSLADVKTMQVKPNPRLKIDKSDGQLSVIDLTTKEKKLIGFTCVNSSDGSIDIGALVKKLPETLGQKPAVDLAETIDIVTTDGSDESMTEEQSVVEETAVDTAPTQAEAPEKAKAPGKAKYKIPNPINPETGKPRRGRPPKGWKMKRFKEMKAAGDIPADVTFDECE